MPAGKGWLTAVVWGRPGERRLCSEPGASLEAMNRVPRLTPTAPSISAAATPWSSKMPPEADNGIGDAAWTTCGAGATARQASTTVSSVSISYDPGPDVSLGRPGVPPIVDRHLQPPGPEP
jgi:hypothetical protein